MVDGMDPIVLVIALVTAILASEWRNTQLQTESSRAQLGRALPRLPGRRLRAATLRYTEWVRASPTILSISSVYE